MRRVALLSLVLAAPLALAACGGGAAGRSSQTPADSYRTAYTKTAKTSVHVDVSAAVDAAGQSVNLSGSGDFDSAAHTGKMDVAIALGTQQMHISEILDGTNAYVSSSLFSSFLPSGKTWLKVPLSSAAKTFGASSFALTDPGSVPPLKDAQRIGEATIDGVKCTEYEGQLDLSKLPAARRSVLGKGHVTFEPVDVWVGSDGYIRRVKLGMSTSTGGTKAKVALTTTLSQFGEKVTVTPPPASATVDGSKMQVPGFGGQGA